MSVSSDLVRTDGKLNNKVKHLIDLSVRKPHQGQNEPSTGQPDPHQTSPTSPHQNGTLRHLTVCFCVRVYRVRRFLKSLYVQLSVLS